VSLIEERRAARQAVEDAENVLLAADERIQQGERARPGGRPAPGMAPPRARSSSHAVTLNILWVAEAISDARQVGWRTCIEVWQPLLDFVNNHPRGHREALDEVVSDPTLRKILYDALEQL